MLALRQTPSRPDSVVHLHNVPPPPPRPSPSEADKPGTMTGQQTPVVRKQSTWKHKQIHVCKWVCAEAYEWYFYCHAIVYGLVWSSGFMLRRCIKMHEHWSSMVTDMSHPVRRWCVSLQTSPPVSYKDRMEGEREGRLAAVRGWKPPAPKAHSLINRLRLVCLIRTWADI